MWNKSATAYCSLVVSPSQLSHTAHSNNDLCSEHFIHIMRKWGTHADERWCIWDAKPAPCRSSGGENPAEVRNVTTKQEDTRGRQGACVRGRNLERHSYVWGHAAVSFTFFPISTRLSFSFKQTKNQEIKTYPLSWHRVEDMCRTMSAGGSRAKDLCAPSLSVKLKQELPSDASQHFASSFSCHFKIKIIIKSGSYQHQRSSGEEMLS